jgi:hypothetical protein
VRPRGRRSRRCGALGRRSSGRRRVDPVALSPRGAAGPVA